MQPRRTTAIFNTRSRLRRAPSSIVPSFRALLRLAYLIAAAALAAACCGRSGNDRTAVVKSVRAPPGFALVQSKTDIIIGASGLTADPSGTLWAIPEEERALLPLDLGAGKLTVRGRPLPITGIDHGLDAEAIAAVDGKRFVVGTEGSGIRKSDRILWLARSRGGVAVTRTTTLSYDLWGIQGQDNEGIEGLCYASGQLVVAAEPVIRRDGQRHAPVARLDVASNRWHASLLKLTTASGKISALACRSTANELQVRAVERHYGIARVLGFSLPLATGENRTAKPRRLRPTVLFNLAPLLDPVPNFEGIAWLGDDLFLIADNHHGSVTGRTCLVRFALQRQ